MQFNVEKQAKIHFNNIYKLIGGILNKTDFITVDYLKEQYTTQKKKEDRFNALTTIPLIGKMIYNNHIHSFYDSNNILKVAQFMKKCKLSKIDKNIFELLKTNKEKYYTLYFKEDYEIEIKNLNIQNNAYDSLFPSDLN